MSLLGCVGFLNSIDSDFFFINNFVVGKLKFGIDVMVKLEFFVNGQVRFN